MISGAAFSATFSSRVLAPQEINRIGSFGTMRLSCPSLSARPLIFFPRSVLCRCPHQASVVGGAGGQKLVNRDALR